MPTELNLGGSRLAFPNNLLFQITFPVTSQIGYQRQISLSSVKYPLTHFLCFTPSSHKLSWSTIFLRELNFADGRFFCILQELIFALGKNWFYLLGVNFCDFLEVAFNWNYNIFVFYLSTCDRNTGETTCKCKKKNIQLINGVPSDDSFLCVF